MSFGILSQVDGATSPLVGEVGLHRRCNPGEGSCSIDRPEPLTPTLSHKGRGSSPPLLRRRASTPIDPTQVLLRLLLYILMFVGGVLPVHARERLNIVASFSILGDLVKNVGGDRVDVTTLVGPNGDVHVYDPAPADAKKIADAQLMIVNGFGLEGWLPRLLQASGGKAPIITATKGITPLRAGNDADPHAWQSVANAKIYVANIRDALAAADPADAPAFRANADGYLEKLDALDREVRAAMAKIPPARRKVISTHDAFGYFAAAYGIEFVAPEGVSTESEPSARDIAAIISQVKTQKIPAVFLENISDPRLIQRIAAETGAKLGGTLYSDSLTDEKGEAPTYIELVRHNIKTLTSALAD
jgi:zinc/manganese transport system substrate-binding protein